MSAPSTVSLYLDGVSHGTILVDGKEMPGVRAATVDAEAGDRPEVTLRLKVADAVRFEGLADVKVDAESAAVLRLLGWTPPPVDGQDAEVAAPVLSPATELAYHLVRRAVTEIIAGDHR